MKDRLRASVQLLSKSIGERNTSHPANLKKAADWIADQWKTLGLQPNRQEYDVLGISCSNVETRVCGPKSGPEILIGAHYDSVSGCPGADDNATGVAALMEVSRALANKPTQRPVRCVAFVNEEPPLFATEQMGSRVYASQAAKLGRRFLYMISLESIGYYSHDKNSQHYPDQLKDHYPTTGNFLAIVGNSNQTKEVDEIKHRLEMLVTVPILGAALPSELDGVGWSDHASFWANGFPGLMLTDTAPFRNPNYHTRSDTPDTLDYVTFAAVTDGIIKLVQELAMEH